MKTLVSAAVIVLLANTALAAEAPEGWSRPGGYYDQAKAGSLSKPVEPCPLDSTTLTCKAPKPAI